MVVQGASIDVFFTQEPSDGPSSSCPIFSHTFTLIWVSAVWRTQSNIKKSSNSKEVRKDSGKKTV